MTKQVLPLILIAFLSFKSYSQIVFENGYIIDETNLKKDCLIRNNDWLNNPKEFEYKLSQNTDVQHGSLLNIKEFGINGVAKYIRATVKIDKSREEIRNVSTEINPFFEEEQLFLKVIIESKATLFQYTNGNLKRFFFRMNDAEINQLVFKSYLMDGYIYKNNHFRQQLFQNLVCPQITSNELKNIAYNQSDLKRLFVKYNECTNSSVVNYVPTHKEGFFSIAIRPGLNFSSINFQKVNDNTMNFDFDKKASFRLGIEAEYVFPINKNKWSVIFEPTYQEYSGVSSTNQFPQASAKYQSIELPIGIRHYFFLNNNSKIFINASYYIHDIVNDSSIILRLSEGPGSSTFNVKSSSNIALGLGYKFKNKYSIEFRYQTSQEITSGYMNWSTQLNTTSIQIGYSLF